MSMFVVLGGMETRFKYSHNWQVGVNVVVTRHGACVQKVEFDGFAQGCHQQ